METKQIIFKIAQEKYGIDILYIREIENAENIVPIPNSPACILGIMHLRESVIPIYSLRRKFHMHDYEPSEDDKEPQKLIIAVANEMEIGFLVDSVEEIIEISDNSLYKTPLIVKNEETDYIDKVACVNKEIILLLNVNSIINETERDGIATILENLEE